MRALTAVLLTAFALPATAEQTRQMDAHEHGAGALNIAFDGNTVAMEFHAPGADIVGFEYAAESAEDRAAIDAALATLSRPLDLFALPSSAECGATGASAALEGAEHDADADHDDHAAHDDHDDHDHDDHKHDDAAGHSEFHAEYQLTCANPGAVSDMTFPYFESFPNARKLTVQIVTAAGARAFDITRDAPTLDLRGMF